jgi:hypothetical protein
VTIFHTVEGKRVSFKNVNTPVKPGEGHTLRVDFAGKKFTVTFDGKKVIEATLRADPDVWRMANGQRTGSAGEG